MKYNTKLTAKICELFESDSYTIKEVCSLVGINEDTFYGWQSEKSEFSEAIKKAREARLLNFAAEAEKSLMKKIKGYEIEEVKTIFTSNKEGTPKIKEKTITKKQIAPDTVAVIFALCNRDGERWKNKQQTELSGRDGGPIRIESGEDLKKLSEDELRRIADLG